MNPHCYRLLFALFFFLLPINAVAANGQKLAIYYSSALHGETEPCG
jgi:hypothetical protein